MSAAHLGPVIDIHAGGQDLVFPHHENEIAQSRCAHGTTVFARYWLHNGFVTVDKRKMSKSLGNTQVVHELLKHWPGEAMRYLLLSAHYRQPLDWSENALRQAVTTLDRLYRTLEAAAAATSANDPAEPDTEVVAALEDDLNTPAALAALNRIARELAQTDDAALQRELAGRLHASGALLGLLQQPEQWRTQRMRSLEVDSAEIDRLVQARSTARAERDFATADSIRDQLDALGVELEDGPDGTSWRLGREVGA